MFRFSRSKHPNFLALYHSAENIFNDIPMVRRKRFLKRYFKVLKFASAAIGIIFIAAFLFIGTNFVSIQKVIHHASNGKNNLEMAVATIQAENFNDAISYANIAGNDFRTSIENLTALSGAFIVKHSQFLSSEIQSLNYLLNSAEVLSVTVEHAAGFASDLSDLTGTRKKLAFSKFTPAEREKILRRIYISAPELAAIRDDLDLALFNITQVDSNGVLYPFRDKIFDLKDKIVYGRNMLDYAIPLSKIMPRVVGYPGKASYLVVLQNNDELRPTGGFIGTYGILDIDTGDISRFDTHDIYHLDMPVEKKLDVLPPDPIKKYLNKKWYMRDANWSPDWPTSAEKILWFYHNEDKLLPEKDRINNFKGEFSGVIAITPGLVMDLLRIVGPITIGNDRYDSDNFTELLQYKVEKGYYQLGVPSWQRKEVIGEIVKELKIKLFDLPSSQWPQIISVLKDNALKKDFLLYLKDRELENMVKDQGWGGEIKKADKDYLMVVDANLGALKTDSVMARSMDYSVTRNNGLISKLRIDYAHQGVKSWKIDMYKSYTRIYVPYGSKLISIKGGSSEVEIGSEAGKTFFAVYLTVEPGKIKNLELEYRLPERLENMGNYELFVQKQPGKSIDGMVVDLKAGNRVISYSPTGFYADKAQDGVRWKTDLSADRIFTIGY